jgi:hypothetical protein
MKQRSAGLEDLALADAAGGAVLKIHAAPGSSRDRIVGVHGDALKVAVAAPPEHGKANARIVAVLAAALDVPRSALELLAGAAARDKRLQVTGLSAAQVRQRLHDHLRA